MEDHGLTLDALVLHLYPSLEVCLNEMPFFFFEELIHMMHHAMTLRARLCSWFSTGKVRIVEIKFCATGKFMFSAAAFP